ncbi:TetR family transcriptional regulator (fragment) [Paraburkholderia piptadeniae]|uniref:TetR family transcriptional regulator n=1 Tax=Paraburkholderia piptadeniae TaxID=1701573 RepID=A0A1N7RWG8_9BURK
MLKALLEHQRQQFEQIAHAHMAKVGTTKTEPCLSSQIAIYRESVKQPHSVARAILAALVESPELLADFKATDAARMKKLREESSDLELSLLRYFAASGLAFHSLLGLSPLPDAMMNRLFDRLLDESAWTDQMQPAKTRKKVTR